MGMSVFPVVVIIFFFSVDLLFHALQESSCDHLFVSNVLHTLQETSRDHLYVNHLLHTLQESSRDHLYV